ncbi:hypothetical protein [Saccharolobus shibatae]|uniref:Uncharacterized protein n=1 Tax=Saccharolobus shibatae TaxID=2286 RepID=A0A8F5GZ84_9CREN|nr:hypothetical protein [Saccharolobus shibatae]QXJ35054.1 hypothetical protein J5U22_01601 [Saccharolobus shibatae]
MFGKLLKLIIFSRFSKWGLATLIAASILASAIFIRSVTLGAHSTTPSYYSIAYITALYILFSYIGGFTLMKADLDYLFTLPIDRKKLGIALYISSLIIYLIIIIYLSIFSYNSGLLLISPLLGVSLVSLNLTLQEMRTSHKVLILTVIALWFISPLIGFKYSPTSSIFGHFYESLSVTLPYTALLTFTSIRKVGNYDQILMKKISRTSGIVKHSISFNTSTPLRTILQLKLTYFPLVGRAGFYTPSGSYSMRVIRMSGIVIVTSVLGIAYFIVFRYGLMVSSEFVYTGLSIATTYIAVFSVLFVGMSNLMSERIWLTIPSIGYKFFKYMIVASGVQSFIIILPFGIVDLILSIWNPLFLNVGISLLFYIPLSCMLYTYLLAMVNPLQLKDEFNPVNVEFRGRSFLIALIFVIILMPLFLIIYAPLFFAGIAIAVLAITITYLLRDKMILKVVNKMTEAGYI